ncbi:hypothetical protein [Acinetobacter sp.]|uniref:hypothetical protein n=1 Tax=Acinetobacter sp. TaxID=472 RepID=UPI0035AEFF7F
MKHQYLDELIHDCKIAKQSKPTNIYIYSSNDNLEIFLTLYGKKLKNNTSAIYIIKEINGNPKETHSRFIRFKSNNEMACPKINPHPSEVLYVGSSSKNIINRLKQHVLGTHTKTYALRLINWFQGDYEIEIRTYSVSSNVLQLIEDDLSYTLRPAFGKTGSNNK